MLLERDDATSAVVAEFDAVVADGAGRFVDIVGEAGGGKTTFVRHVTAHLSSKAIVYWGACDSLSTPRALGPFADIAIAAGGELAELLATGAARDKVFAAGLRLLASTTPTVVIVEDIHWADDATIDMLTFLRRRIERTNALVIVTYRDAEVTGSHPVQRMLGDTPRVRGQRLHLEPLSVDGVAALSGHVGVDPAEVHRITGGNPFFVTEVAAAGTTELPSSVRDAVLARAARLSDGAQRVLCAIAIVPANVELWLIDALVDSADDIAAVDELVASGVLLSKGDGVTFRHELARLAIRSTVTPIRRRDLHVRAATALLRPPDGAVDHARVAHHAYEAGNGEMVVTYAPLAAAEAARLGAHQQAAAHLDHALRYRSLLDTGGELDLWGRLTTELTVLARYDDALVAWEQAMSLARSSGDEALLGDLLTRRAGPLMTLGRQPEAIASIDAALAVLEPLGPTPQLAAAAVARCGQHMLARELADAALWGERAIGLATQTGRRDVLAHTLIQAGVAQLMEGDDVGHERILEGMAIAHDEGLDSYIALGYSQIGSGGGEVRRYGIAVPALVDGLAFAATRDLTGTELYMKAWLARCHFEQGRWRDADALLADLFATSGLVGIARMVAVTVLGRLRARRGDPGGWEALDESLSLARDTGHLQRLWPTAVARAEAAWLEGRVGDEVPLLQDVAELAAACAYPWAIGETAVWLRRAGIDVRAPAAELPAPFAHELAGRFTDAAGAWDDLGCSFEAGVALLQSNEPDALRAALARFDALGATPAARLAANALRRQGARVPRGPNASTLDNPCGLTSRELDVLALLVEGLRNADIAERLVISAKTVDHHVSRVLAKLGVATRHAAAVHAVRMGLVAKDGENDR